MSRACGPLHGLARNVCGGEYGRVPGTSRHSARKRLTPTLRERQDLRKRVGAFLRKRREELGLSQGDIIKTLGYTSRNSVSNLETGREGLPAKRIYAWADILQVPRDAFFRFVTGESARLDVSGAEEPRGTRPLITAEKELLETYRALPPKYQQRLREQAREFETLARAGLGKRKSRR